MSLSILINGAKGRMGQALSDAAKDMGIVIGGAVDVGDDFVTAATKCDVIVDFSSHAATKSVIASAVARKKPLVIGTTGHPAAEKKNLLELAAKTSCVWA